jgi:hypothetical protein
LLAPHGAVNGPPHLDLLTTEWRCIISRDNTRVGDELDLDTLAATNTRPYPAARSAFSLRR